MPFLYLCGQVPFFQPAAPGSVTAILQPALSNKQLQCTQEISLCIFKSLVGFSTSPWRAMSKLSIMQE